MLPGWSWYSPTRARTLASVTMGWSPGTKRHPGTPESARRPWRMVSLW